MSSGIPNVDVPKRMPVDCGVEDALDPSGYCTLLVWRTYAPAGSLWCPKHGHLIDVLPPAPLSGVAILCGPDGSTAVDLGELQREGTTP